MSAFHPLRANNPSTGKHFGSSIPRDYSMTPGKSIARSHMRELVEFLGRAAAGDESNCPTALDPLWHRWLEFPQAYAAFCTRRFGIVIEHVIDDGGKCYGEAIAGIEQVSSDKAPCKGQVKM